MYFFSQHLRDLADKHLEAVFPREIQQRSRIWFRLLLVLRGKELPSKASQGGEQSSQSQGGKNNGWKQVDRVHQRSASQHDRNAARRRRWTAQQQNRNENEDATLANDALRLAQKWGKNRRLVEPTKDPAVILILARKGLQRDRTRVNRKRPGPESETRKKRRSPLPVPQSPNAKLGPQSVTMPRLGAEGGNGFVVVR